MPWFHAVSSLSGAHTPYSPSNSSLAHFSRRCLPSGEQFPLRASRRHPFLYPHSSPFLFPCFLPLFFVPLINRNFETNCQSPGYKIVQDDVAHLSWKDSQGSPNARWKWYRRTFRVMKWWKCLKAWRGNGPAWLPFAVSDEQWGERGRIYRRMNRWKQLAISIACINSSATYILHCHVM